MTEKDHNWAVLDLKDKFILYTGSLQNCEEILEHSYSGLTIMTEKDATAYIHTNT